MPVKTVSAEAVLDLSQRAVAALERIATKLEEISPSIIANTVKDVITVTPPDERDCDTCQHDGECLVTMLKCKGYLRAEQ